MKSKLLIMGALCAIAFAANAQTKGTNTIGLGVNVTENKYEYQNSEGSNKNTVFNLNYGYFIQDNQRIGVGLSYGTRKNSDVSNNLEFESFGINASYQKYYPLIKTLYAYAGANTAYGEENQTYSSSNSQMQNFRSYSVGAMGGLTWFVSKRFAFETNLLAANISYSLSESSHNEINNNQKSSTTQFNLTTQGFIDDLGFKIYLLF